MELPSSHSITLPYAAHASSWLGPHILDALERRGCGVLYISEEGRVMYCNVAARKLLGLHHAQIIGVGAQELRLSDALQIDVMQLVEHQRIGVRSSVTLLSGERVEETLFPVRSGPVSERGLMVLLRPMRQQEEYLAQLGLEWAQACHDGLNQLSALKAWASLLASKELSESDRKIYGDEMIEGINRLEQSMRSTLAPLHDSNRERIHLAQLVEKAWALVSSLGLKQCSLRLESSQDPLKIASKEEVLLDCLINLFKNAISAAQGEWVYCWVDREDPWVILRIMDGGHGPKEEDFLHLYSHSRGGHGLGLSSVQQQILALGGSIDLERDPDGKGILVLRFPMA